MLLDARHTGDDEEIIGEFLELGSLIRVEYIFEGQGVQTENLPDGLDRPGVSQAIDVDPYQRPAAQHVAERRRIGNGLLNQLVTRVGHHRDGRVRHVGIRNQGPGRRPGWRPRGDPNSLSHLAQLRSCSHHSTSLRSSGPPAALIHPTMSPSRVSRRVGPRRLSYDRRASLKGIGPSEPSIARADVSGHAARNHER